MQVSYLYDTLEKPCGQKCLNCLCPVDRAGGMGLCYACNLEVCRDLDQQAAQSEEMEQELNFYKEALAGCDHDKLQAALVCRCDQVTEVCSACLLVAKHQHHPNRRKEK